MIAAEAASRIREIIVRFSRNIVDYAVSDSRW